MQELGAVYADAANAGYRSIFKDDHVAVKALMFYNLHKNQHKGAHFVLMCK